MSERFQATIKARRIARGLTREHAAALCGVDISLISRLEAGQRNPTRENIRKIVVGYELTATEHDTLLALAGFAAQDPVAAALGDEPAVLALYQALRGEGLDDVAKSRLRSLVGDVLLLAQA